MPSHKHTVYVASLDTRHGTDIYLDSTEHGLKRQVAIFAKENANTAHDEDVHAQILTNFYAGAYDTVIDLYFTENGEDWISFTQEDVTFE